LRKIIEVRALVYTYPDGTEALKGVSFHLLKGEALGIVGPNGAGKSTLLLNLNGILSGSSRPKILGMEVNRKNLPEIRSKVGLVFQDPDDQLFMSTVFDDVAFGPLNMGFPPEDVLKRVESALKEVGMTGHEKRAPYHLSIGEKKRVAIATVLSMYPEILVMDEPSSNLDPRARRLLIRLLKSLPMAKIIASHDLELVLEVCERCILLDGGVIIKEGPTKELFSNKILLEDHGLEVPYSLR
jgi:cobalt/nickel transport system ATP-binding protein